MELAVHLYSKADGPFSTGGDSGLVITDPNGWIVGFITGGTGVIDSTDITYATPYYWVEQHIKMDFPNTFFYLITAINSQSSTRCSLKC